MKFETILPLLISVISLLISLWTLRKQRKRLTVTFDQNMMVLDPQSDILVGGIPYPVKSDVAFYFSISIVNPSSVNMSFFDLRVFNPENNINQYILTRKTLVSEVKSQHVLIPSYGEQGLYVDIPMRTFGTIKAGEMKSLEIIVFHNLSIPIGHLLTVSFKIPDTSIWHRSRFAVTNRKIYRAYDWTYNISNYEKCLMENKISKNADGIEECSNTNNRQPEIG